MNASLSNRRRRQRRRGMLTLEWVALVTVLCIGIIGGLGVVRVALVSEFVQLTEVICDTNIGP